MAAVHLVIEKEKRSIMAVVDLGHPHWAAPARTGIGPPVPAPMATLRGRALIRPPLMVLLCAASSDLSSGASEVTVTDSAAVPTSSPISTRSVWATCTLIPR